MGENGNHLSRKQIAFDLKQDLLKRHYPKPKAEVNPQYHTKAYRDMKSFFKGQNWEHRQGSVYVSNDLLTYFNISDILDKIAIKMPWLHLCAGEIDVTNVGEQHSLKEELASAMVILSNKEPDMP